MKTDHTSNAKRILTLMKTVTVNLALYPEEHPQIVKLVEELHQRITTHLATDEKLVFSLRKGEVFYDEEFLLEESLSCIDLLDRCEEKNVDRIIFLPGINQKELRNFLGLLREEPAPEEADFSTKLRAADIDHIEVKRLVPSETEPEKDETNDEKPDSRRYELAAVLIGNIFAQARENRLTDVTQANNVVEWLVKGISKNEASLVALTSLKNFNDYTCRHSINVAILSLSLGARAGLDDKQLALLGTGALLHDIGKMNIPEPIINKPDKLSSEEWALITSHPIEGIRILAQLPSVEKAVLFIAFEHHLGHDLSGYPKTGDGVKPHVFSRIVQVADVYDGLTSERSYHRAYSPTEALAYMQNNKEIGLDPTLVEVFAQSVELIPVAS